MQDQIDITVAPFSDRGSRLLVYQQAGRSALYIKLAERLIKVEAGLESYLRRPPYIDDFCFIDEQASQLDFTTSTSAEMLTFHSRAGDFRLVFQDTTTLAIGLPDHNTIGMRFRIRPTHWHATGSGGALRHVRNATYQVINGVVTGHQMLPDSQGMIVEIMVQAKQDCSISLHIGDDDPPEPIPFSTAHESAHTRWKNWFDHAPTVHPSRSEKYAYAWWVMANNLISPGGYIKYEAMMPTKAFYVGAWLWDSALHAIALRHVDPQLARNQIRVMLANQLPDGMLPDAIFDEGVVSEIDHPIHARVTKPPIMAWAALKIHRSDPQMDFLQEIYEPLKRWNAWWFDCNDEDQDGIVEYRHPYSSGLDNNPLWDGGMPVESPDLNTYLVIQMNSLAEIAEFLGRAEEAAQWKIKAMELTKRMMDHFWDEEAGIFRALRNKSPIPITTPFNLYPLWTGQLPKEMNDRLLTHLNNPSEFWGRFGLPSVAFNDLTYDAAKMWRGPVWANINYFFIEALQNIGEHRLASELRHKTLQLITDQAGMREYYNSQTGEPPEAAAQIFGWSAAVFIELCIQEELEISQTRTYDG